MKKPIKKPRLSFWQIWNMSFGFLGIQFGFALQNANVSRIFETLGANVNNIPILWIAAPVTGLIVQPIIGHLSDQTWTRLGRRRPYFLGGAILASTALFIMPYSPTLWVAAGMLWMMDASINISMEPFRAFIGDMMPTEQHTTGFAMQSFFIGIGAVVASALPYIMSNWIGIANTAAPGKIPPSLTWSFIIGGIVYLGSVLWTVFRSKEYPPDQFEKYSQQGDPNATSAVTDGQRKYGTPRRKYIFASTLVFIGLILTCIVYWQSYKKELYIFGLGMLAFGLVMALAGRIQNKGKKQNGLVTVITDLLHMPKTMVQLAIVQFFSWFALFSMWIYMTPAVTAYIYGTADTTSALYNQGANWVGICFAIYNGFAAIIALALPKIARWTSRKLLHALALLIGGLSLASIYLITNPTTLIFPMLGIGFAWGSILAMPYAFLSGAIPPTKMGVYMGIFNFFIVIPQIVAASILGFMLSQFFGGHSIDALVAGGVSLMFAALLMFFVNDKARVQA